MANAIDQRLILIVERIERLLEERRGISDGIRDVYAEAKAVGYDAKAIRALIQRRAMKPDDRAQADLVLETYEAAIGMGDHPQAVPIAALRPDAAALALDMLTAEVVALEDEAQASALVEHVLALLDLRAEIALLRSQEADRRRLAKGEGFAVPQLQLVVRWFEKVARHGLDAMQLGEATFGLYRGTVNAARAGEGGPVSDDPKLGALFQPPAPPKAAGKKKAIDATMAWLNSEMGN